jgi:hypothetical protein
MSSITYHTFLKDFVIEKQLGKGTCASVSQVIHSIENKRYALKITELNNL